MSGFYGNRAPPATPPKQPSKQLLNRISQKYNAYVLASCAHVYDSPIVYASQAFVDLTMYGTSQDLLDRSGDLSFMYGIDTHPEHARTLPEAINSRKSAKLGIVLYKKTGSAFVGRIQVQPLYDDYGVPQYMLVALTQVSDMKNPLLASILTRRRGRGGRLRRRRDNRRFDELVGVGVPVKADKNKSLWIRYNTLVIDPQSRFRLAWDWLVFCTTVYCGIVDPYNAVFHHGSSLEPEVLTGDIIVMFIFIGNILVNFHTLYYDEFGQPVKDLGLIARQYRRGWLLVDVCSAVPYELLYFVGGRNDRFMRVVMILKLTRMIRLAHLPYLWTRYSAFAGIILVVNMTLYVLVAHWFACAWYLLGAYEWYYNVKSWNSGWIYALVRKMTGDESTNKPIAVSVLNTDNLQYYWSSFYYSMTMLTTVGFGNESANSVLEKVVSCIVMPLFALANAVVLGNVTALLQRMYARRNAFDQQTNELKKFYDVYNVPKDMRENIQQFYNITWAVRRGISHDRIVGDLPEELKAAVLMHVYKDLLSLPSFDSLPRECRRRLALMVKHSFINPGDYLCRVGDSPRSYYFISSGKVVVHDAASEQPIVVEKNSLIGGDLTSVLYKNAKCKFDISAKTYCDLFVLKIDDLVFALSAYPEYAVDFSKCLEDDLSVQLAGVDPNSAKEDANAEGMDDRVRDMNFMRAMHENNVQMVQALASSPQPASNTIERPKREFLTQFSHVTSISVSNKQGTEGVIEDMQSMVLNIQQCVDMINDQLAMAAHDIQSIKHTQHYEQ